MKKRVTRLSVNRETVRVLKDNVLLEVAGGIDDIVSENIKNGCYVSAAAAESKP